MSNKMYDVLKDVALIWLTPLATFVLAITEIWGLPYGGAISGTLLALDTLLCAVLKISSVQYNKKMKMEE